MHAVCVLVVGIQCTSSCVLICALASINVPTISTWPLNEAFISGVQPFCMNNVVTYAYISHCMCIVFLPGLHIIIYYYIQAKYILLRNAVPELNKQVIIIILVIPSLSVTVKEQEGLGLGGCRGQRPHCDSSGSCKSEKLNMQLPI